jgi:hypothetical protein
LRIKYLNGDWDKFCPIDDDFKVTDEHLCFIICRHSYAIDTSLIKIWELGNCTCLQEDGNEWIKKW